MKNYTVLWSNTGGVNHPLLGRRGVWRGTGQMMRQTRNYGN